MDLKRYNQLKNEVDKLQREADRSEGALEQLMTKLKDEFECNTIGEAEELVLMLEKEANKAEKDYDKALEEFEEEFQEVLG